MHERIDVEEAHKLVGVCGSSPLNACFPHRARRLLFESKHKGRDLGG